MVGLGKGWLLRRRFELIFCFYAYICKLSFSIFDIFVDDSCGLGERGGGKEGLNTSGKL